MQPLRILLVQLAANGDCLFLTTIAKQIKEIDYPGSHLTWMIGSRYVHVLTNNPFIDDVIEISMPSERNEILRLIESVPKLIDEVIVDNKFDKIFITDYTPINYKNWFGTTRSSLFRSYPHKLRIDPSPLIFITDDEKKRVKDFCQINNITNNTFNILFECSPQSGQSHMTFDLAIEIAKEVISKSSRVKFILSTPKSFISDSHNIIDGSAVTWRENAELSHYCQLLVGCSSGISWLCTSSWANAIPTIQIIDPGYMKGRFSASMKTDFRYFGIDTGRIIELYNPSNEEILDCILLAEMDNFALARKKYNVDGGECFKNYKFLMEANIPWYQKCFFLVKFHFLNLPLRVYRKIKPKWFVPGIWLKKY